MKKERNKEIISKNYQMLITNLIVAFLAVTIFKLNGFLGAALFLTLDLASRGYLLKKYNIMIRGKGEKGRAIIKGPTKKQVNLRITVEILVIVALILIYLMLKYA